MKAVALLAIFGSLTSEAPPPSPASAAQFCMEPRAPIAFLIRPRKPFCAASRDCDEWQVRSYKNDLERYFTQLKQYAADVDEYYKDASEYVGCMARLD